MTLPYDDMIDALHLYERHEVMPVVIDIETTIVDGSPDPKDGAEGVLYGLRTAGGAAITTTLLSSFLTGLENIVTTCAFPVVLIGHNIKFDLKHIFHKHEGWFTQWVLNHPNCLGIWDTGIFEYLESGQTRKFPSLSDSLKHRGISESKIDEVSEIFQKGLGADHVDPELLREYLLRDLDVTLQLYKAQLPGRGSPLYRHMFVQGWAAVAYTRMENVGMPFDVEALTKVDEVLGNSAQRLETLLARWIQSRLGGGCDLESCKPTNRALSTAIFGAPGLPVKVRRLVGKFKNGKPKYLKGEERLMPHTGCVPPKEIFDEDVKPNPHLGWPTTDTVLTDIEKACGKTSEMGKIAALIKQWRKATKIVGTYTGPLLAEMERNGDHRVFHTIHNTSTSTGRTSSTKPNGQNMPEVIRECVAAKDTKIVQFDFSQLEVCIAAQLSGDLTLRCDVETSDVHYETGKSVMGWRTPADMDKHNRRLVKGINFGIIYGGGKKTLSEQTGVPENLVEKQIKAFKDRYHIFADWQRDLKAQITRTPGILPEFKDGETYYYHPYYSESGRKYMYKDHKRPWDGKIGPSPSMIVNYPVQGFATGDIVPLFIAALHGWKPMATAIPFVPVHDSVAAVKRKKAAPTDIELEVRILEEALPRLIKEAYKVEMMVPLKLDLEIKDTWT